MYNKIIMIVLSFFFYFGCQTKPQDHSIVLGMSSEPSRIDPIYAIDLSSQKLNRLLFRNLFVLRGSNTITGDLVEKYEWKNNDAIYLLLKQTRTHTSMPISAEDVSFSINRLLTTAGPRKSVYNSLIQSVEVQSNKELVIRYNGSKQKFLEALSLPPASIYSKDIFLKESQFVSSGKYYIQEWNKNQNITLYKNPNYTFQENYPPILTFQNTTETSNAVFLFSKNKLNAMKLPYFLSHHSITKAGTIKRLKSKSVQYIAINHKNKCFDGNFRKALNYSIDKEKIIQKVFEGEANKIVGPIPLEYYNTLINSRPFFYEYNLEKAKDLLKVSQCYPAILEKQLELRMKADDENKAKGAAIAEYLKRLGLKVKIKPLEKINLYKDNSMGMGDLTLLTWYIDYDSIYNFIDPLFYSKAFGNGGNRAFYSNLLVDDFILKTKKDNPNISDSNTLTIIHKIIDDAPWVFLWSLNENYLLSKNIEQFQITDDFLF